MPGQKERKGKGASYSAPAVDMALDVIEFLSENQGSFGINELSRRLGMAVNSVYRVLMRLSERGYVELNPSTNGYQLSTKLFSLGMRLHGRFDLRTRARRHLERLSAETGETCQIQMLQGARMLSLDSVAPQAAFYVQVVPGSLLYCHANAHGKAVLAFLSEERLAAVVADGMPSLTERTITKPDVLRGELERTRLTGLSYDNEEYSKGIYCVVAPVFDVTGEAVASVGVTGLASRLASGNERAVRLHVLECAAAVSADIGYEGDVFTKWMNLIGKTNKEE